MPAPNAIAPPPVIAPATITTPPSPAYAKTCQFLSSKYSQPFIAILAIPKDLDTNAKFKYSPDKLAIVKHILDEERYLIVKSYLRSIERDINNEKGQEEQLLFGQTFKNSWVNEGYINYLSQYSNNIIQFSRPKVIDVELNDANFKRVFEKYIFKYGGEHDLIPKADVYGRVQQELFPKIKDRVNLNRTLTSYDFGNLFTPIEIDFIGINGMPVAGQTIDARFVSLTKAIELEGNQRGKYYVLGREPQHTTDQKNHRLWEHIQDSNFLDFVDDYIEKNDVRPFFAE